MSQQAEDEVSTHHHDHHHHIFNYPRIFRVAFAANISKHYDHYGRYDRAYDH